MTDTNSSSVQRKETAKPSECQICGTMAIYSYFGVKSCRACKVFFRRNAQHAQNRLTCFYSGQCQIDIHARHICAACRLKKCFEKGMKTEMIRASLTKQTKKQPLSILLPVKQTEQIRVVNILNTDTSLFDQNQWTLLTNLVHNYEEKDVLQLCSNISNEQKLITKSIMDEIIQLFYKAAGDCIHHNQDIARLSLNDRSILLHTASTNLSCLGAFFVFYYCQFMNLNSYLIYLYNTYGQIHAKLTQRAVELTNCDYILCKLSLCLVIFSTHSRMVYSNIPLEYENPKDLLEIENKYVEIIWKYLLYKYGLKQSIEKYLEIIRWFISATIHMSCAHTVPEHINDIERLVEDIEIKLILDDIENDI